MASIPAISFAGLIVVAVAGFFLYRKFHKAVSADELEKQRRQFVSLNGKLGDGEIIDLAGSTLFYTYDIAGVNYTTSQEVGGFALQLPQDRMAIIGPVSIRYIPANPANSIVACEEWSGLRNPDMIPVRRA